MEKYLKNITLIKNQGLCNVAYISKVKDKKYFLKKFIYTGIDRKLEFKIQNSAYKVGIAAKPILVNKKYMVCEFLKGNYKQKLNRKDLKLLARALKKLHKIKIVKKQTVLKIKDKKANQALLKLQKMQKELVLTHHDLTTNNIIFDKKVKFIDWEFSGKNDRYFDLASICVEFKLHKKDEDYFFKNYNRKINRKKLKFFKIVYIALCEEWLKNKNGAKCK